MKGKYSEIYERIMEIAASNKIDKQTYLAKRRGRRPSVELPEENYLSVEYICGRNGF